MRDQQVVDVEQEAQLIPFFPELALVALRLFVVDAVVDGDGHGRSHMLHERQDVAGVSGVGTSCRRLSTPSCRCAVVSGSQHVIFSP